MKNHTTTTVDLVRHVYEGVYEDQVIGATDDYLVYFEGNFSPEDVDWTDLESAIHALSSLAGELYEDRADAEELLVQCGATAELLAML